MCLYPTQSYLEIITQAFELRYLLTRNFDRKGRNRFAGPVDGFAHVHALVLLDDLVDVHGDKAEVVSGPDTRADWHLNAVDVPEWETFE